MKPKHVEMYMKMAEVVSSASYANRLKVGALAVRDHRVLSIGYNGTPPGMDNACEELKQDWEGSETLVTKREVIHAEMNLIYKMARDGQSGHGADLFLTHSPCFECSKAILTVGFKTVWYRNQYRDSSGLDLLTSKGVEVKKI